MNLWEALLVEYHKLLHELILGKDLKMEIILYRRLWKYWHHNSDRKCRWLRKWYLALRSLLERPRRLEAIEVSLKKSKDLPKVEITFTALSVHPFLSRSTNTSGDDARSNWSKSKEDRRVEEGIVILVSREPDGERIFKCWNCNELGHYSSKFPKREKKYKNNFKPRRPRDCLNENGDDEFEERV